MIGGIDVIVPSRAGKEQAVVASLRLIRRFWPSAVVEDANTGQRTAIGRDALLPETLCDLFIYPDEETANRWDELGAEPELANTMIHLLVRDAQVTAVVDDPQAETIRMFLSSLRSVLSMNSLWKHAA